MKNEDGLAFTVPFIEAPYLSQTLLRCPQILHLCIHARSKLQITGKAKASTHRNKNFKVLICFLVSQFKKIGEIQKCFFLFICIMYACEYVYDLFLSYVYVSVWVSHMCASSCGGQKRALESLELKLQAISCYVGTGNRTWILWKSRNSP